MVKGTITAVSGATHRHSVPRTMPAAFTEPGLRHHTSSHSEKIIEECSRLPQTRSTYLGSAQFYPRNCQQRTWGEQRSVGAHTESASESGSPQSTHAHIDNMQVSVGGVTASGQRERRRWAEQTVITASFPHSPQKHPHLTFTCVDWQSRLARHWIQAKHTSSNA